MPSPRNLPLAAKGLIVVAIPVAALLMATVVFYQSARDSARADRAVDRAYDMRSNVRRLITGMLNAETGIRGYLLTRRAAFLAPYEAAVRELPEIRANLRRSVQEHPSEADRLERIETLTTQLLAAMDQSRSLTAAGNQAAALAELESDKKSMDALRAEMQTMTAYAQSFLDARSAAAERAQRRVLWAALGGGAIGILGGLLAALLFTTGIAARVRHLEDEARDVAAGRAITHPVTGDDEIARLERALQETSQLLHSRAAELAAAQAELESRVAERTADLQAANEVRDALVRSSPVAIWAVDLGGKVTFWNPAAERIFGWTEAEVIGRELPVVRDEDRDEYSDWLRRFAAGESLTGVERTRRHKDGAEVHVMIWTAPLRDAQGRIRGAIAIDSDISQQKILEEQFRQSQKLEAVGRLAGGVAHDFNNLLTVIHGYADMISIEAEASQLAEYAHEIEHAASRATGLTTQLLAFSRRQISQPKVINLNELIGHSVKLLRRVIGEDIEVVAQLDPALARIKADPIHIDQILMNLVVNARDAMPRGGRITIETRNVHLDADYAGRHIGVEPGPYTLLAVSDTGTGMTAETRAHIFEPFFTTKEAGKGTGLGLSIVYGIVKQSGGEILVYSEPGRGTTFKIYFPVVPAVATADTNIAAAPSSGRGETVLVCEDEDSIRELIARMLARQGYRPVLAPTPEDALRAAREGQRIDLLLTDLVMPRMSGFDLAREMAQLRPGLLTVYMSGYTDSHLSGGVNLDEDMPFLQKPFTATALAQTLRQVFGERAATSPGGLPSPSTE